MKFKDVLNEGLSPVLYHFTSLYNILKILEQNKLKTSIAVSSDVIKGKKEFYFVSFARSKTGYGKKMDAYMVFDGRKLMNKYKGVPVNYWGVEWLKNSPGDSEQEDRLITDDTYIPVFPYLKEVHIRYNESDRMEFKDHHNEIKKVADICKKEGIKFSLVYMNKQYSNADVLPADDKPLRTDWGRSDYVPENLGTLYDMIVNNNKKLNDYWMRELEIMIQQFKRGYDEGKAKDIINSILAYMRKNKIRDIEGLRE